MIDIHSHILNNVDDGSNSIENSLQILEKAEKAGFTDIIFTPHFIEGYYENTKNLIREKIAEFKNDLYKNNIIIQIHQGNEILLTENSINLLDDCSISTLANSRYILFELPFSNRMMNLEQIVKEIKSHGFIPVLAHPERYTYIQENPNNLIKIMKWGVLVQSNYGSIVGQYGKAAKRTVEILLENQLVNFLGSDTHKQGFIYDNFPTIMKRLEEITGDFNYIDNITTNNQKYILRDLDWEFDYDSMCIREKKKVFFFF